MKSGRVIAARWPDGPGDLHGVVSSGAASVDTVPFTAGGEGGGAGRRSCRSARPPCPAEALPCRGDGSRVADANDGIEIPDVDAELQRVRRHHAADRALAQASFDGAPLVRQVAAAIAEDRVRRYVSSRVPDVLQDHLDRVARAGETGRGGSCTCGSGCATGGANAKEEEIRMSRAHYPGHGRRQGIFGSPSRTQRLLR